MGRLVLQHLAVISTGLTAGAMILIGVSWVQVWQAVEPAAFLSLFAAAAPRIGGLMVPMGACSGLLSVAAAVASWRRGGAERLLFCLAAALMLATAAIYPVYYTETNAAFESGSFPLSEVAAELGRWESWHWVRTTCGLLAFVLGAVGLSRRSP